MKFKYEDKTDPRIKRVAVQLGEDLPNLAYYFQDHYDEFRGISMFLGDNNGVVIGLRKFGDNAKPMCLWSSGTSVFEALINVETGLENDRWIDDKKEIERTSWGPPKKKT